MVKNDINNCKQASTPFNLLKERGCSEHDVTEQRNQHFFPFYLFTSANVRDLVPEYQKCSICGCGLEMNQAGYFSAYWVFYNSTDVRIICSKNELPENIWDFDHQRWGNRQPLVLPEYLAEKEPYKAIFNFTLGKKNHYRLKSYKAITMQQARDMHLTSECHGCSNYATIDGHKWSILQEGLSLKIFRDEEVAPRKFKEHVYGKWSTEVCLTALNEILKYNNQEQLSLF